MAKNKRPTKQQPKVGKKTMARVQAQYEATCQKWLDIVKDPVAFSELHQSHRLMTFMVFMLDNIQLSMEDYEEIFFRGDRKCFKKLVQINKVVLDRIYAERSITRAGSVERKDMEYNAIIKMSQGLVETFRLLEMAISEDFEKGLMKVNSMLKLMITPEIRYNTARCAGKDFVSDCSFSYGDEVRDIWSKYLEGLKPKGKTTNA